MTFTIENKFVTKDLNIIINTCIYMTEKFEFELKGQIEEIFKKKIWKSGGAKTPSITIPKKYLEGKEEVQLIIVKKPDGNYAIVIQ